MSTTIGHTSPVPRKPGLARMLGRDHRRIRRLEVNNSLPAAGFASYDGGVPTAPAASTWSPDLSPEGEDSIGLFPGGAGFGVPYGWMFWATVNIRIVTAATPEPGDFLQWGLLNDGGNGDMRADPLIDSTLLHQGQQLGASCIGSSANRGGIVLQEMSTALGTLFTVQDVNFVVTAIRLPAGGYPPPHDA